jgi:tRNA A37 N6-isopentenylltransferase MiaA
MSKPKLISLVGITASGKSALGIKLAQEFGGEIVSCDSRQVYRGLDIGTAKVTKQEQELVKHHMIDVVAPGVTYNVHDFQKAAYVVIDDILARGKVPILVGGSGLYSRAVVEGYGFKGEANAKYDVLQICLVPPREVTLPQVIKRIDERLAQGMIAETEGLIKQGVSKEWLSGLGLEYYWNVLNIEGNVDSDEYKRRLKDKTMQFIKRQRTWFRKEKNTIYLTEPKEYYTEAKRLIKEWLA